MVLGRADTRTAWHGSAEFTLSEAEGLTTGRGNGGSDEVRDFDARVCRTRARLVRDACCPPRRALRIGQTATPLRQAPLASS
jgi:hypothetical protein